MEAEPKPKRVLTEAQRLAFLKGREKRMANIEKKKLEAEEAKQVQVQVQVPMEIPEVKSEPAPAPAPAPLPPIPIDEEKLASSITERVLRGIQENKPKRKPYVRKVKEKEATPEPDPEPKPIVHNFSWL